MHSNWKITAFSLAATFAAAYVLCATFDAVFPSFGLLAALGPASPWPIGGSLAGFAAGIATAVSAGFVLGAVYGFAYTFWSKRIHT